MRINAPGLAGAYDGAMKSDDTWGAENLLRVAVAPRLTSTVPASPPPDWRPISAPNAALRVAGCLWASPHPGMGSNAARPPGSQPAG